MTILYKPYENLQVSRINQTDISVSAALFGRVAESAKMRVEYQSDEADAVQRKVLSQ